MRQEQAYARRIFVDTSAFVALTNRSDQFHGEARRIQEKLRSERWAMITSNFVRAETHPLLLNRLGRDVALRTLQAITNSSFMIIRVNEEDELRAFAILTQYRDKTFSFTDATSFSVMERLELDTYFSFDRHFTQYGFRPLTADET